MKKSFRVNEDITADNVRLVGDNVNAGVYNIGEALDIADKQGLDLVEISVSQGMSICKVIDYSKFQYLQKKKNREIKSNLHKVVVKEVRFTPNTSDHDFDFKLRHAISFLQSGAKVKVSVRFVGRQIMFKERGELILLRFSQGLEPYGKVEHLPKLEGKRMSLLIVPLSTKK